MLINEMLWLCLALFAITAVNSANRSSKSERRSLILAPKEESTLPSGKNVRAIDSDLPEWEQQYLLEALEEIFQNQTIGDSQGRAEAFHGVLTRRYPNYYNSVFVDFSVIFRHTGYRFVVNTNDGLLFSFGISKDRSSWY